ncbi:HAD-IA family hydrolase [Streptomyces sclerotialus]|uniref:HAD family hydrolase n=1 Tax=Streptomyces sclerotialus TaxID=1957 RepID=UPI00068B5A53
MDGAEEFGTAGERARTGLASCLRDVRAVVFDTDGVLVDSARLHAAAWKEAFDACLRAHPPDDPAQRRPFDVREDYRRYVDGKSRLDGALAFLESRGLRLPEGETGEEPGTGSVGAVAAEKERRFVARLHVSGAPTWPGTVRLLHRLDAAGIPCAAVSASRHARELLTKAGLIELFRTVVDGQDAARLGLHGKPDPALFLEAARRLEVTAATAAVVEDALAGVEAGRRGGFGLVVGVDRTATPESARDLRAHGADVVVGDLGELLTAVPGSAED